ncbi:hypothetical protein [Alloyangia pacifica]|uniref:Uncharacterized protein n=1 Tax=Alloyangia pacifica TaxID=311180 RepID=A0A1I6QKQ0_9RHOB|nr:hypothetical protein [Alloyangia pacifica]SDF91824.1 hypothetical protein SAMN04488245_101130 [Alloyangia pacifica]SFS52912.1 hypothetical protein SAMN04488050_102131 [Alloyangia pacifica]
MPTDPSFAEQFGLVIGAIATLITAIGGVAIMKGRKETKAGEGPSQGAAILAELKRQTDVLEHEAGHAAQQRAELINIARSVHHLAIKLDARSN